MSFGTLKKLGKKAVKYGTLGMVNLDKKKNEDPRADAAGGLVRKDVQRQAGQGVINFTEEK
jgi:hypothetical protein